MKTTSIFFLAALALVFGSCVLREADPDRKQEVYLFTDQLTEADSSIIKEFERHSKCDVKIVFLSAEEYLQKVRSDRYNTGADVLWFSNDSIREKLYENGHLYSIKSTQWDELEGEFSPKHQLWFPVCHDPLVLAKPKDSLRDCANINFKTWHVKDSMSPKFISTKLLSTYSFELKQNALSPILVNTSGRRKLSNETIWSLSSLAKKQVVVDSTFRKERYACKHLISINKKHITRLSCVYIARYARNLQNANRLTSWLISHHQRIASARNQLSCVKNTSPNYIIRDMTLFF